MFTTESTKLFGMIETVLGSLIELPLEECQAMGRDLWKGDVRMTACVHINGSWNGMIYCEADVAKAVELAGAMFQMDTDELAEDEVRDAFGEIANLMAGQYKNELPEGALLTLPIVTKGSDFYINVPGGHLSEMLTVTHGEYPFMVRVIERR
jgi:chemotaxis protein CheX